MRMTLVAAAVLLPLAALPAHGAGADRMDEQRTIDGHQPQRLALDVRGTRPERVHTVEEALARADSPDGPILPGHENADGVGPGSGMVLNESMLCTAAYLFESSGVYYLSTAGHCLMTDAEHRGPIDGTSDLAVDKVEVCFRGCRMNWGAGVDEFLGLRGEYVSFTAAGDYHPVAFAQAQSDGGEDIGFDFGLIRIPSDAHALLRPWLPQWGGPTAIEPPGLGLADTAVHFGHGTYCCPAVGGVATRTELDQGRVAQFNYGDAVLFEALAGWSSGGDSGSAVGRANPARLESKGVLGDTAVGVLTHGLITGGGFFGTVYQQGLALAAAKVTGLALVTEDGQIARTNGAPTAADDTAATDESTSVVIAVLANDSDPDGDALHLQQVSAPSHGTATGNPDGTVTYTPADGFTGGDSFTYSVSDGRGGTDSATVSVTVRRSGNAAPDAVDDTATTRRNKPTTIAVLANDHDPDGDPLRVVSVTAPAHGTAQVNTDGTVTYRPQKQYTGEDAFSYTIDDGHGGTDTAQVVVTIDGAGGSGLRATRTPAG